MIYEINLRYPFLDIKGYDVKIDNEVKYLSDLFADFLSANECGVSAMKSIGWAIDLSKHGKMQLDETDFDKLINFLESDKTQLSPLGKYRLIQVIKREKERNLEDKDD